MHTALGYWNRIHHHGSHMQTTVGRPLFLDFEDGATAISQTHVVGVMGLLEHETSLGELRLELQLGNGAYHNGEEIDPNNSGDNDDGKGFGGRLAFYPNTLEGLGIGLSVNIIEPKRDILNADGVLTTANAPWVDQLITAADLTYIDE